MVGAQESVQSSKDKFVDAFNKAVEGSMLNPPHFPSDFLEKKPEEEAKPSTELPKKLALNFYLPHESYFQNSEVGDHAAFSCAAYVHNKPQFPPKPPHRLILC